MKTDLFIQGTVGGAIDSGSVLDFMSMKSYPDMSLDMLNTLGKTFCDEHLYYSSKTAPVFCGTLVLYRLLFLI